MPKITDYTDGVAVGSGDEFVVARGGSNYRVKGSVVTPVKYYTPEYFGAVGNGVADDTSALQAMYDEAAGIGAAVYLGRNKTYGVTATVNAHGANAATALPVVTKAAGGENVCRIRPLNDIAGPVINCAPTQASQQPSFEFHDVYIDMSLAPSATGLSLSNLILAKVYGCKFRLGAGGLSLSKVGASWFRDNWVYNSTIGYRTLTGTSTAGNGNIWDGCWYYMTSGAAGDVTAGFMDESQQQDSYYSRCHVQRNAGVAYNLLDGFLFNDATVTANTGSNYIVQCNVDGITDGTIGLSHAGFRFVNQWNCRMTQCWASTVGSGSNKLPAVLLDGCHKTRIENTYMSGRGLRLVNTCDLVFLGSNQFPTLVGSDPAIRLSGATVTNLMVDGHNVKYVDAAPWFDDYAAAQTAMVAPGKLL
jgi:hypothetical protein